MKPKRKPKPEELKYYQTDVKYRGKDYGLSVSDKVAEDGVTEAHFDFSPHFRPKGAKSRGNFGVQADICKKCKMMRRYCTCKKKKHRKNCGCLDCDTKYGPGQEALVEKIQKKLGKNA